MLEKKMGRMQCKVDFLKQSKASLNSIFLLLDWLPNQGKRT